MAVRPLPHTTPDPTDEITFESFTTLTALAFATQRVRLGHIVSCAGFRNPALVAKMIATMNGGNGRAVTWRLAARHADELNVDAMAPGDLREALPVLAQRCEEVGRDPATLRVSVHLWRKDPERNRREPLAELLAEYSDLGVSRVMALLPDTERSDEPIHEFVETARSVASPLFAPVAGR